MSAEDQPQRPRNGAGNRWIRMRPVRQSRCGWCSAHTAAFREKFSRRERIFQGCSTERPSRNRTNWERHSRAGGFPWSGRGRPVPVPEGCRRRLAGGKSAPADAAPGKRWEWLRAPAGHRRNGQRCGVIAGDLICTRRQVVEETAGWATTKNSPMPRWGMPHWTWQPGAAPAVAGLPPANFLRCPSGTKHQASETFLRWAYGCQGNVKPPAAREDSSRSAAVCAEHQPQPVGRMTRLGFRRVPAGFGAAAAGPPRTQPRSWVAAPPLGVHSVAVIHHDRPRCTVTAPSP